MRSLSSSTIRSFFGTHLWSHNRAQIRC